MIYESMMTRKDKNPIPDEELWLLFKSGDKDAFSQIYENNVDSLYNYGMSFAHDDALVRDSIQDLFFEIWNRREYLGGTDNIRYYLLKSLRRKLFAFQKEQKKWLFESIHEKFSAAVMLNKRSVDHYNKIELQDDDHKKGIREAMEKLPSRQKEALFHIYYEKLTYEEAASVMDVHIKTVYNLAWRGIEKLRKELREK